MTLPKNDTENPEFSYELKISEERIAVLIGEKGETKKEIEALTKTLINVSKDGDVTITGKDALLLYTAQDIVKAIARGFNPKIALLLLKADYTLEIIKLKDFAGKEKGDLIRVRGRVIGKEGRSRAEIERLTDTHVSVYGKTVAIIGETTDVFNAIHAVTMLLKGSMHRSAYGFLERKKKDQVLR
ncbi:RNA-processing protein [Candidatus Woesearchaeota archaeon]|nr:RNA-processing protein [Candidatus Woesearchaeota archaeon]